METTEKTRLSDKIISGLRTAATELEELRLQGALGKAEAKDAYEEVKKTFNKYVQEAKSSLGNAKGIVEEKSVQVKTILETLQVQLALGKAETKEIFEEQRKKIAHALNELETIIKKNETANEFYAIMLMEVEKFKIKLEILKLRYELNKLDAQAEFENKKKDLSKAMEDLKGRLLQKEGTIENKWGNLMGEIIDAYSHLKKAFVK